jgi:hypothetical protein
MTHCTALICSYLFCVIIIIIVAIHHVSSRVIMYHHATHSLLRTDPHCIALRHATLRHPASPCAMSQCAPLQ